MKTLFTSTILLLAVGAVSAQPAFTNSDYFTVGAGIGDTFALNYMGSTNALGMALRTATGSNYTWDYATGFGYLPSPVDYSCPVPTSAGYISYPPLTNLKESSIVQTTDNLYQKLADTVYLLRQGSTTSSGAVLLPKIRCMTFSLQYGDSLGVKQTQYTDTFLTTPGYVRTQSYKYDGYGTVALPWGTYNNVFRIKMDIRDSSTLIANYITTYSAYYYFRQGDGMPLVRFISASLGDSVNHIYSMIANKNAGTITAVTNVATAGAVSMYPNPAHNELSITSQNEELLHVTISDMAGRKLVESTVKGNEQIPLHGLAKGIYLVTIRDAASNIISCQKLVKTD